MAVGDVIAELGATNAYLNFTPAAGVEIIILALPLDYTIRCGIIDYGGTIMSNVMSEKTIPIKVGLTNSFGISLGASGGTSRGWYSGIQIK